MDYINGMFLLAARTGADVYEHFSFGHPIVSLQAAICAIMAGVFLAAVYLWIKRRVLGRFVRALDAAECHSPDSAKTLEELGFSGNLPVARSLKSGTLSRVLSSVEKDAYDQAIRDALRDGRPRRAKEGPADCRTGKKTDHFYLSADTRASVLSRFEEKRGDGWLSLVLCAVVCAVIAALLLRLVPGLLQLLDQAL